MALVQRLLNYTFVKASGSFTGSNSNTLNLAGLRSRAAISLAGTVDMVADVEIYGMTLSQMNDLAATIGWQFKNLTSGLDLITILAGDPSRGMATVFQGTIMFAYIQGSSQPDVALVVRAHALGSQALNTLAPTSITGSADVTQLINTISQKLGRTVENTGVSGKLANPYLWGSTVEQLTQLANSAGFQWAPDADGKTLAVWATGKSRPGSTPLIAPPPAGQMIGYPTYTGSGLMVRTVFDPSIKFGGSVQIKSQFAAANKTLNVYQLSHELESNVPGGKWESTILAQDVGPLVTGH